MLYPPLGLAAHLHAFKASLYRHRHTISAGPRYPHPAPFMSRSPLKARRRLRAWLCLHSSCCPVNPALWRDHTASEQIQPPTQWTLSAREAPLRRDENRGGGGGGRGGNVLFRCILGRIVYRHGSQPGSGKHRGTRIALSSPTWIPYSFSLYSRAVRLTLIPKVLSSLSTIATFTWTLIIL